MILIDSNTVLLNENIHDALTEVLPRVSPITIETYITKDWELRIQLQGKKHKVEIPVEFHEWVPVHNV